MSSITTINSTDVIANSRADINTNFSNLNTDKIETSVLDTDTSLAANSDSKIATQKAVKAYVDAGGNINASETVKGIVEEATDAQTLAGTAVGETGAKLFITPAKHKTNDNCFSSTATENITIGQPVGIANLAGGVSRAKLGQSTAANGITTALFTGQNTRCYCSIGGDKFVYLNYTAAGSDTLFAQVGSVNTSTNTVTVGTAQTVATAFTPAGTDLSNACISKLGTDKFIVFYLLDASTTVIKYRVGTVSGTTITFGTEATTSTAATTVATSNAFGSAYLADDKGVFFYKAATTTSSKIIVFTVSGTVATFGAEVTPGTQSQLNVLGSFVTKIATDKFALVTSDVSNSSYGQVFTCSGTTITAGTEAQITTTSSSGTAYDYLFSPATDVFVYKKNSSSTGVAVFIACTVATRTITAGTTLTGTYTIGGGAGGVWWADATTFYHYNGIGANELNAHKYTLSGTTITDVGVVAGGLNEAAVKSYGFVQMDNNYPVVVDVSTDATLVGCYIYGMASGFIGFAQETVSKGSSIRVLYRGVDANQSGLNIGRKYKVTGGTLTAFNDFGVVTLANSTSSRDLVTAITATQVIF